MNRRYAILLMLGLWTAPAAADDPPKSSKPPTPAAEYQALLKEFSQIAHGLYEATTDEERKNVAARMEKLSPRVLEFAQKYPSDPIAPDALVQVITQEVWLESNTTHPGRGDSGTPAKDNPQATAIAILLRDHLGSPKMTDACRRAGYGFSRDCETLLRTALKRSPHRQVQGMACLLLAQFLKLRQQRLDLLEDRPEMAKRYERLFGKDYLAAMRDRTDAEKAAAQKEAARQEIEGLLEQAADKYGDVKLPYTGTVGEKAKSELHELRHLSVGRQVQEIDGLDQDGRRFKLSDYRGQVVLLYFWSEY